MRRNRDALNQISMYDLLCRMQENAEERAQKAAYVGSESDKIRNDALLDAIKIIDSMPTVDAQPVKHGKWITTQQTIDDGFTTCSCCHREFYIDDLVQVGNEDGFCEFCPSCGSDNRGDADADS